MVHSKKNWIWFSLSMTALVCFAFKGAYAQTAQSELTLRNCETVASYSSFSTEGLHELNSLQYLRVPANLERQAARAEQPVVSPELAGWMSGFEARLERVMQ